MMGHFAYDFTRFICILLTDTIFGECIKYENKYGNCLERIVEYQRRSITCESTSQFQNNLNKTCNEYSGMSVNDLTSSTVGSTNCENIKINIVI